MTISLIQKMVDDAADLCTSRGVRLTPQRSEVLRIMAGHSGAISAYDLLDKLRITTPQAKPPTVYRALDFLLEQGFIHRVESTNSYVVCPHFDNPSHASVMLICDHCNEVSEQSITGIEDIILSKATQIGFTVWHNIIETHGLCDKCQTIDNCSTRTNCSHDHSTSLPRKRQRPN